LPSFAKRNSRFEWSRSESFTVPLVILTFDFSAFIAEITGAKRENKTALAA
jgi:hypothetical protein